MGFTFQYRPTAISSVQKRLQDIASAEKDQNHDLKVGVTPEKGSISEGGVTIAEVAAFQEFGTRTIPERSFLRSWFDAHKTVLQREMVQARQKAYRGDTAALSNLGHKWADELKGWVQGGASFAPLAESTVQAKAAAGDARPDSPLIASGKLIEAIGAMLDGASL